MSLSDIMSHLRLDVYAETALILFLIAFAAMTLNAFTRSRASIDRAASMPLDDEPGLQSGPENPAVQGGDA